MRLAQIDWSSEGTWLLISIFVVAVIALALVDRATSKHRKGKAKSRSPDDERDLII